MTLKSLEKLRNICDNSPLNKGSILGDLVEVSCQHLADEIQAEVDEFYLPSPLFEDGEPVQVGDYVDLQREGMRHVQVTGIEPWIVYGDSTSHQREPYKRPPEPDTQEKIDADLMLSPCEYCDKRGLDALYDPKIMTDMWPNIVMRRDLLARQRKLDGVE